MEFKQSLQTLLDIAPEIVLKVSPPRPFTTACLI